MGGEKAVCVAAVPGFESLAIFGLLLLISHPELAWAEWVGDVLMKREAALYVSGSVCGTHFGGELMSILNYAKAQENFS